MIIEEKSLTIIFVFVFFGSFILAIATEDSYKFFKFLSIMLISLISFMICLDVIEINKEKEIANKIKETQQSIISQEFDEILKEDNTYNIGEQYLIIKDNKAYVVESNDYKDFTKYRKITEEDFSLLKYTLEH